MTRPDCITFVATWQAVLDGDVPAAALDSSHAAACPDCAGRVRFARILLNAAPPVRVTVPSTFAAHTLARVTRDRRTQRHVRLAGVLALAAGVAVAIVVSRPAGKRELVEVVPIPTLAPQPVPAPRVVDVMADAGSVFASLTRRAADAAPQLRPASIAAPSPPAPALDPFGDALAAVPAAAASGFEPITDGTMRAINLFRRDAGLQ